MDGDVCEYLGWDSEFFGRRIARTAFKRLDRDAVQRILDWCHAQQIDCLYFLADAHDPTTIQIAEDHRFRLVDTRITLERRIRRHKAQPGPPSVIVRPFRADDLPTLRRIARSAHRASRFYHDGRFAPDRCDAFYETWIEKSCHGLADAVLVADTGGEVGGYISCHNDGAEAGRIGLCGVDERLRGIGLGAALVDHAITWFSHQGVKVASVVTQGRNLAAQRLYRRCEFEITRAEPYYHRWFVDD